MVKLGVFRQFLAAFTCSIVALDFGLSCSWGAANFSVLTSNDTSPLPEAMTTQEASVVVSFLVFGGIFGTTLYSCLIDRFGRKVLVSSIAVTQLISWVMILFATNVYHMYAARLIAGIVNAGILFVLPVFCSEIADDDMRGTLGVFLVLFSNAGTVLGFVLANYLDYYGQIKANIILPVLCLIAINFFPETPTFLLKQNQKSAAEKSRDFYRGTKSSVVEMQEMQKLDEKEQPSEPESTTLSLSDFCTPAAKKATAIALFVCALNQLCGSFAMMNYTNRIFEDAGSNLSPNNASIVVASVQLFANCLTMILADRAGRKILTTISSIGSGLGLLCMGLYDVYKVELAEHKWITIASFSAIILFSSIGVLPLTFVIVEEILPKKIKNVVSFLAFEVLFSLAFILVLFYPTMTATFGTSNCMFMFASCCAIGAVFFFCVLPETKNKSYEEIMKMLEK